MRWAVEVSMRAVEPWQREAASMAAASGRQKKAMSAALMASSLALGSFLSSLGTEMSWMSCRM